MVIIPRKNSKLSLFFLFCFTLLLTLLLCLPWVNAKETPKPKPQAWQINGIVAALDDGYDEVKRYAFYNLREYDLRNLQSVVEKPEDIAQKVANILKDKSVDSYVRSGAAEALGNLGEVAKPYVKDIADILKDKFDDYWLRSSAAEALGNLGKVAKPYFKDIADILLDKSDNPNVRSDVVQVLGNLGELAKPYVKDIADILLDKSDNRNVRSSAAQALGNLGEVAKPYVKDILDFLLDKSVDSSVRFGAAKVLGKIEQLNFNNVLVILDSVYYAGQSEFEHWRFLTYFLGGGTQEVKTLLKWLGLPNAKTIPTQINDDERLKTLNVLKKAWQFSIGLERLQQDLAKQIPKFTKKV